MNKGAELLADLRGRTREMVDLVGQLVSIESPSADFDATTRCAHEVADIGRQLLGAAAEVATLDGRPFVRWDFGDARRVVCLCHLDTVWPLGTLARWPFEVDGDVATGPGAFDMKSGIVQLFFALSSLDELDGLTVLVTSDEEVGSLASRSFIEEAAQGAEAVLVLEPSAEGALKIARKGVSLYDIDVIGRAAHAGLEPEKGVNATVELANQVIAIAGIARPSKGTTVTPTVASSGTAQNVVPAAASLKVDVRTETEAEAERVDREMKALSPVLEEATVDVRGGPNRPPLARERSAELFELARACASDVGIVAPEGVAVGGGSDGNFTAGLGIPTLDGLGAVGGNAHAEGEWLSIPAMPERAALVATLIDRLLH